MPSKKKLLYADDFTTHFNTMYDGIFRDKYDTYDNRYNLCYSEYMNGIKYNRSKRNMLTHRKDLYWKLCLNKLELRNDSK